MTEDTKKRRKRKLVLLAIWAALIAAAIFWVRCGSGWGIGGGSGKGSDTGSAAGSQARRCAVRVTATGIEVDGKPATRAEAVARCPQGADVVVTGDAREGDWRDLQRAFEAAHVPVFRK